ncbi:MAG: hypothetical protein U0531_10635 [Dehalococcoidia bacterium]
MERERAPASPSDDRSRTAPPDYDPEPGSPRYSKGGHGADAAPPDHHFGERELDDYEAAHRAKAQPPSHPIPPGAAAAPTDR